MPGTGSRLRPLLVLALLGGAALLLSDVSAAQPVSARAKPVTIRVTIRDTRIALSKRTLPAGTVTFVVKNVGKLKHNFKIGSKKTPVLAPKKQAKIVLLFKKAGSYAYRSTLASDRKTAGLKGSLEVTAAKAPATTTTPSGTPGDPKAGKTVFTATGCNTCHTLAAAGAKSSVAANLDQVELAYAAIVDAVTNGTSGPNGAMTAFKGVLSTTQIQDVAAFIYAAEHP
jgi:cytochrome c551